MSFVLDTASLLSNGMVIATPDLLVAATALYHNFTVITHNVRHFTPVPDLRVQDWLA
jgi:tRNA(fMet)-specific endonuclease VapC